MKKKNKINEFGLHAKLENYASLTTTKTNLEAKITAEIQKVQQKHAKKLLELSERQNEVFDEIHNWANSEGKFDKVRSKWFALGKYGYRTGKPKLQPKEGVEWDQIRAQLISKKQDQYLRTKTDLNKSAILTGLKDAKSRDGKMLQKIGLEIVQEEIFFIKIS